MTDTRVSTALPYDARTRDECARIADHYRDHQYADPKEMKYAGFISEAIRALPAQPDRGGEIEELRARAANFAATLRDAPNAGYREARWNIAKLLDEMSAALRSPASEEGPNVAKLREAIADAKANPEKGVTFPASEARRCATCHAVLADGPQPRMTYEAAPQPASVTENDIAGALCDDGMFQSICSDGNANTGYAASCIARAILKRIGTAAPNPASVFPPDARDVIASAINAGWNVITTRHRFPALKQEEAEELADRTLVAFRMLMLRPLPKE